MAEGFQLSETARRRLHATVEAAEDALVELDPMVTGARPATPGAIARGLRALLASHLALVEALLEPAPGARPGRRAGASGVGAGPEALGVKLDRPVREAEAAETLAAPPEAPPPEPLRPAAPSPDAPAPEVPPSAAPAHSAPLGRAARPVVAAVAEAALRAFPLEDLNRWLASGTVFQIRGSFAYFNMASMGGTRVEEMSGHIRRMGFADEMGTLETEGLVGVVLLFRRPE